MGRVPCLLSLDDIVNSIFRTDFIQAMFEEYDSSLPPNFESSKYMYYKINITMTDTKRYKNDIKTFVKSLYNLMEINRSFYAGSKALK